MSTIDFAKLAEKFPESDLDWRLQQSGLQKNGTPWGMAICFVDARAIMNRLDAVCGPENWRTKFTQVQGGMLCELAIRIDGEWVTKMDGSDETDTEPFKGSISKALVRAAVSWNVGRYLYDLPVGWADFNEVKKDTAGARSATIKDADGKKHYHYWLPPKLPAWAIPAASKEARKDEAKARGNAAAAAAEKAPRDRKKLQDEIASHLRRAQIKPSELSTITSSRYDLSDPSKLDLEQLEDLLNHLETGK